MTTTLDSRTSHVDRWHRQIGRRARCGHLSPRPLVAFDVHVCGPREEAMLVPVERLHIHVVYDCEHRVRFGVYGARRIPWGVSLGGVESHRIERDAALEPLYRAREARLDAADGWLLGQVLRMDRRIERHRRRAEEITRDQPQLPTFWASFEPDVVQDIDGDGPELNGLVHETGRSAGELLAAHRREHGRRVLLPLAWVSHHWESMAGVLADLDGMPRRQLFRLGDPAESLVGFRGACQYDLLANRFAAESGAETRHVR